MLSEKIAEMLIYEFGGDLTWSNTVADQILEEMRKSLPEKYEYQKVV